VTERPGFGRSSGSEWRRSGGVRATARGRSRAGWRKWLALWACAMTCATCRVLTLRAAKTP